MKQSLRCPKCDTRRIWVIERFRIPGDSAEGRPLPLVPHQPDPTGKRFASLRISPRGAVDLFACAACGYSELWASGLDDLVEDPERGVRLVNADEPGKTPFR